MNNQDPMKRKLNERAWDASRKGESKAITKRQIRRQMEHMVEMLADEAEYDQDLIAVLVDSNGHYIRK